MEISLHIPTYGELWYRQKLLADPRKAEAVRNCFEEERVAALKIHLAAGFREIGRKDGAVWLECRRKE